MALQTLLRGNLFQLNEKMIKLTTGNSEEWLSSGVTLKSWSCPVLVLLGQYLVWLCRSPDHLPEYLGQEPGKWKPLLVQTSCSTAAGLWASLLLLIHNRHISWSLLARTCQRRSCLVPDMMYMMCSATIEDTWAQVEGWILICRKARVGPKVVGLCVTTYWESVLLPFLGMESSEPSWGSIIEFQATYGKTEMPHFSDKMLGHLTWGLHMFIHPSTGSVPWTAV